MTDADPPRPVVRCALFDLDGVIRHFDPDHPAAVAEAHGIPVERLVAVAFRSGLLEEVVVGRLTRAQWRDEVGRRLDDPAAAAAFFADIGSADPAMVDLVGSLRARGVLCALLTNGTDTIPAELTRLGLDTTFNHVFNTADIGAAKPDPAPFRHVCDTLALTPPEVFFTDDRQDNVDAAVALGMTGHRFDGIDGLRARLEAVLAGGRN